ncbi:MAG: hypothetical protein ACLQHS_08355 [Candidatus Limnocylindrales bacterium]
MNSTRTTSKRWPDERGPFVLTVEWSLFDDRLAVSGVTLRLRDPDPDGERMALSTGELWLRPRRPVKSSDLRRIPLRAEAEHLRQVQTDFADVAASMAPEQAAEIEAGVAAWRVSAGGKRGPRPDLDWYRRVARVYMSAASAGHPSPTEAVAAELYGGERTGAGPSTNSGYHAAGKAIHRARALGLLPKVRKGGRL